MNDSEYSDLGRDDNPWTCPSCGASSLLNSTDSNSFSSLSDSLDVSSTDSDTPTENPSPFPDNLRSSSPIRPPKNVKKTVKTPQELTLLSINFQGIMTKVADLAAEIENLDPDIIVGTETFLHSGIRDAEFLPLPYTIHRNDRQGRVKGGVFIAVKNTINCSRITNIFVNIEYVACKIELLSQPPLIINAAYRPPLNDLPYFCRLCNEIEKTCSMFPEAVIWTAGDFNLPDINWFSNSINGNRYLVDINERVLQMLLTVYQEQMVTYPTYPSSGNILDIFLTNRPSLTTKCIVMPGLSDHDMIFTSSATTAKPNILPKREYWDWKSRDIVKLHQQAISFSTDFVSSHSDQEPVQETWDLIKDNLLKLLKDNVPLKTTNKSKKQPWMTNKAKKLCRRKYRWFRRTKQPDAPLWVMEKFLSIKAECQREVRRAKDSYLQKITDTSNGPNNKMFWGYVKSRKKDNISNTFLRDSEGKLQSQREVRAELFNHQFSSVYSKPEDTGADLRDPPQPDISEITVTVNGVQKLMTDLSPFKSPGPDKIPPFLLKELAEQLAPVFTILFQASLNQATVPDDWRRALISPIFKKGDPLQPANYRPVSLTSIPCKVLEHIIFSHIMKHNDTNKFLCSNQHGFRKKRSCTSQLVNIIDSLSSNLDLCIQTDVVFLDLAKAFDKVNHKCLLRKIDNYGIRNNIYYWIESFLGNRTQQVQVEGALSHPADVTSGVPQGTVLGPLLFLLYINDLPRYVSTGTEVRLFADDTALFRPIKSNYDHLRLQADLLNLQEWESDWSMEFHPGKCELLRVTKMKEPSIYNYTIHSQILSSTDNAKYLGVNIDCKLSWNFHIESIVKKANNSLNFIHRNFKSCSPDIKAKLYIAYVRPCLEYSCIVWDPYTDINIDRLEFVQRRAARVVNSCFSWEESVTDMLRNLNWTPLSERRARAKVLTVYKAKHDLVEIPFDRPPTQSSSRHAADFYTPFIRTDCHRFSFYPSAMRLWNGLPVPLRTVGTLPQFQKAIEAHTITSQY